MCDVSHYALLDSISIGRSSMVVLRASIHLLKKAEKPGLKVPVRVKLCVCQRCKNPKVRVSLNSSLRGGRGCATGRHALVRVCVRVGDLYSEEEVRRRGCGALRDGHMCVSSSSSHY